MVPQTSWPELDAEIDDAFRRRGSRRDEHPIRKGTRTEALEFERARHLRMERLKEVQVRGSVLLELG